MSSETAPPTRTLARRGGAAGGNASATVPNGSYAATPPKSTYTGPKVAGSYGGFVGVFVASGIVFLFILLGLGLWRYRTLRRRAPPATYNPSSPSGGVRGWAEDREEAFEMPSSLSTPGPFGPGGGYAAPYSPSASSLHLPNQGQGEGPRLYQHEGAVSQEAFWEGGNGARAGPYSDEAREAQREARRGAEENEGEGREVQGKA
ncbi:hypothetical protein JCM10213_007810 [Rhodosporidiobolus nylandii]